MTSVKIQDLTQEICGHVTEADGLMPVNRARVMRGIPMGQRVDCSCVVERPKGCAGDGSSEDKDESVAGPKNLPTYAALKPSGQRTGGKQTLQRQATNPKQRVPN